MAAVIIGVDPHKASHTAVVISAAEEPLGEVRVRACAAQAERLLAWAAAWPERAWAVEGADGVGHLLAQQLLAAGERVLDVQPKLSARVRLLAAGATSKNDPNDARSVAVAALRSPSARAVAGQSARHWSRPVRSPADNARIYETLIEGLHVAKADHLAALAAHDHTRAGSVMVEIRDLTEICAAMAEGLDAQRRIWMGTDKPWPLARM
jgi:hypothetical protein